MRNPFTARRPWAVFLVSLFLGPYLGMLYIGRALLAAMYFLALIVLAVLVVLIYPEKLAAITLADAISYANLPYALFGASHAAYLAWKHPFASLGKWYSRWYTVLGLPVAYILLLFANRAFLFPFFYVPTHSMEPKIGFNDFVFASHLSYHFREPARGDVIVFHPNHKPSVVYIKRIVGIPGDRVQMRGSVVILNGKPLALVAPDNRCCIETLGTRSYFISKEHWTYGDDTDEVTVPAGWYYVLGDNRSNSLDSRYAEFGLVARKDIIGPIVLKAFDGEAWRFTLESVR